MTEAAVDRLVRHEVRSRINPYALALEQFRALHRAGKLPCLDAFPDLLETLEECHEAAAELRGGDGGDGKGAAP